MSEWRHGWPVVTAGVVGMTMMALHMGPLGVLMKPLGDIFGWSRSEISLGLMILTTFQFFLSPVVGVLIPRVGITKIAVGGVITYASGLIALGLCTSNIWSWYFGWAVLGVGIAGISPLVWTTAVTRVFVKHRGLALSAVLSGTGFATFLAPLISAYALQELGWRFSFFSLAGFGLLIILPALWLLMRRNAVFSSVEVKAGSNLDRRAPPVRFLEVISEIRVWQLLLASLVISASVGMIAAHLQAALQDAGASVTEAARYFVISAPSLIAGRLLAGVMLDHLPTRAVAVFLFFLPAVTCASLLLYDGSALWGFFICAIFGFSYGAETDVFAYLTARYFGTRKYPLVYSLVFGIFGLGYGGAAVLGGVVFDQFGSYSNMLYGLIVGVAVGIVLVVLLKNQSEHEQSAIGS